MRNIDIQSKINKFKTQLDKARRIYKEKLTLTEKILLTHMNDIIDNNGKIPQRGESYINLHPDRVIMQDATAQMSVLQFINSGYKNTLLPTSIHCDHLIVAENDYRSDLDNAEKKNNEIYDFLNTAAQKYGMEFWGPGSGIIHQVVLENYAFPGCLIIGTDSHTPNAGGLGALAIGVGGTDAVDVMMGEPFILKFPKVIGVKLTGKLNSWSSSKDVILHLMKILTVKGGTGHVVEFLGEGCNSLSTTEKATITNMGAEHGATTSVFPVDENSISYLHNTKRSTVGDVIKDNMSMFSADEDIIKNPELFYDRVINIDLDEIKPSIAGPHTPDIVNSIETISQYLDENSYPKNISAALIGSCTNSSYEDMQKVLFLAKFAAQHKMKSKVPLYISPGSESIAKLLHKNIDVLNHINAKILSSACGPCIGQWQRNSNDTQQNSIITSYNRNFPGRNDGNRNTLSFISSPEVVLSIALSGRLDFDPIHDTISCDGKPIKLPSNLPYSSMPSEDFFNRTDIKPSSNIKDISIKEDSDRLQLLKRFDAFSEGKFTNMLVLLRAKGKCTTDHISPAGPWLKYRGHLTNISQNTYLGVLNDYTQDIGSGFDMLDYQRNKKVYDIALGYKRKNKSWLVIGDENFGEGSSREHAAMQPRFLGCRAVIAKSFARIHENNLKKHGILALTFDDKNDYHNIPQDCFIDIPNLNHITPSSLVKVLVKNELNQITKTINCRHSYSEEQLKWFKHGSALNYITSR